MARHAGFGLQVLDQAPPPFRWWRWWLGLALALAAGGLAFLAVATWPLLDATWPVSTLHEARILDEAAAGLAVAVVALLVFALAIGRRFARATETARQQRIVLDAIIANAPDPIVVADSLGRFRANAAAVRLFGFKAETGDAGAYHEALARLDRRSAETGRRIPPGAGVLEAALAGRALSMDQVIATPDGPRTVRVSGSPIPLLRGARGGLIVASDVTARLAIQSQLRAANEGLEAAKEGLQRKNAEHLQMARAIAHDLGNALTPAEMHVEVLKSGKADLARSLSVLRRSIDQMHRLVGDLSDMARLESGAMTVTLGDVDLRASIQAAVASHQPAAEAKGITLEASDVAEATVRADAERLGQVLSNLLGNAIKFTPQGSVGIAAKVEPDRAVVTVTDTGLGLDADQMARLFRPFSRVHDPERVRERGTGLGLYICKALVERQGGELGVTSAGPGHGSTFWFTLPLATAP